MRFINREEELKTLKEEYQKEGSSFVIIYGRRRTGKTTLIKRFIEGKKAIYFLANLQSLDIQIEEFKSIAYDILKDEIILSIKDLKSVFKYISNKTNKQKLIIVIDEFQYLADVDNSIPSLFQSIWDEILKDKNIMLILCGSLIGLMHKFALSYKSPLYGRRTSQIHLTPLSFPNFKKFFNINDVSKLIEYYAVLGGVPRYIEFFDESKDIYDNIKSKILYKNSYLYEEPNFILKDEVKHPITYFSILQVIAQGEHKIGNIASKLNIQTHNLTSFIEKLIELDILKRVVPITEENPAKSKKGLYYIKDNFFNFWFRYVFPNKSYLEIENYDYVLNKIKLDFHIYTSFVFEQVVLESIHLLNIPFDYQKIGRYWDKDVEIDIMAIKDDQALIGECKYWNKPVGIEVLNDLKQKSNYLKSYKIKYYALFSKSGFADNLRDLAKKDESIILIDLKESTL
ncbi:MAG: ATPase [Hydrogenobaculum sp.]|nr:MAG: ATPase [Hydrogenobaculum sp.]